MKWLVTLPPAKDGSQETRVIEGECHSIMEGFALIYDMSDQEPLGEWRYKLRASYAPGTWLRVEEARDE